MQLLTGLGKEPLTLAFSPDGRLLAAGADQTFHVWDLSGGSGPVWSVDNSSLSRFFSFTTDSRSVVGGYFHGLGRYDARTGARTDDAYLARLGPTHFAPGGQFVLCAGPEIKTGTLRLRCARAVGTAWADAWEKALKYSPAYDWSGYRTILFSAAADRLVRVYPRGRRVYPRGRTAQNISSSGVEVFDTATAELVAEWRGPLPVYAREGAANGNGVVVLLRERAFFAIDANTRKGKPVKRVNSSPKHFTSVAFSRDGTRLATTSNDTAATIWDTSTWEVQRRCEWQIGRLRTVCFAPDGLRCAAAGDKGQIVVWDLDD